MLARTLLPAAALAIPERMHAALLLTLSKLERGELVHGPTCIDGWNTDAPDTFNMTAWHCGSAYCILGWARLLAGDDNPSGAPAWWDAVDSSPGLYLLCYPDTDRDLEKITTDQAAAALRNYLATGSPDWAAVLP